MAPWATIAIIIAIAAAIAGLIVWAVIATKRKKERFTKLAAAHGWTVDFDDRRFHDRFPGFDIFDMGHTRRSYYVVRGEHKGHKFAVFRYQYTTGSGKEQTTHIQRVVAAQMPYPAPPTPGLTFKPERWGHKLFDALGGSDIDFESDEFSKAFWIKCDRERFAYAVFHPRMMEHMLANRTKAPWQWIGNTLVGHWTGGLKVGQILPMIDEVVGWAEHLPRAEVALPR